MERCDGLQCTATFSEAFRMLWSPYKQHTAIRGWGGYGFDAAPLNELYPSIVWGIGIYLLRSFLKPQLMRFGIYLGMSPKKKKILGKFQNQLWLAIFYIVSTLFGCWVLHNESFFHFPLLASRAGTAAGAYASHPKPPTRALLLYYNYEIGFYFTEIISLFVYGKRLDFYEMGTHHLFTLMLLVCSHLGGYHRMGAYVLLIHDASDIMLSVSKTLVYSKYPELVINSCFACFVLGFIFFRLICLPSIFATNFGLGPKLVPCTVNYWNLMFVTHTVLQGLHVYWFYLIVRMAMRVATKPSTQPREKDIRSSSDEDNL